MAAIPPPTVAPPTALDCQPPLIAKQKANPVRIIAAKSDSRVSKRSYPVGPPGLKASMAMKCVAQIEKPLATAVAVSHINHARPCAA
jgi:hypothetical protein